jgi:hypothetical protein
MALAFRLLLYRRLLNQRFGLECHANFGLANSDGGILGSSRFPERVDGVRSFE